MNIASGIMSAISFATGYSLAESKSETQATPDLGSLGVTITEEHTATEVPVIDWRSRTDLQWDVPLDCPRITADAIVLLPSAFQESARNATAKTITLTYTSRLLRMDETYTGFHDNGSSVTVRLDTTCAGIHYVPRVARNVWGPFKNACESKQATSDFQRLTWTLTKPAGVPALYFKFNAETYAMHADHDIEGLEEVS